MRVLWTGYWYLIKISRGVLFGWPGTKSGNVDQKLKKKSKNWENKKMKIKNKDETYGYNDLSKYQGIELSRLLRTPLLLWQIYQYFQYWQINQYCQYWQYCKCCQYCKYCQYWEINQTQLLKIFWDTQSETQSCNTQKGTCSEQGERLMTQIKVVTEKRFVTKKYKISRKHKWLVQKCYASCNPIYYVMLTIMFVCNAGGAWL